MKKNLVLTGMMGVGKSTLGKILSERLNLKFIDVDRDIEKRENMSIREIFEKKSEEYFRKTEKRESLKSLMKENSIIALGGGAFVNKEIRNLVKKNSISFWLSLSVELLAKRLSGSKKRPLLDLNNLDKSLRNILRERKEIYKFANFKIDCNYISKAVLANKIIKLYESEQNKS